MTKIDTEAVLNRFGIVTEINGRPLKECSSHMIVQQLLIHDADAKIIMALHDELRARAAKGVRVGWGINACRQLRLLPAVRE